MLIREILNNVCLSCKFLYTLAPLPEWHTVFIPLMHVNMWVKLLIMNIIKSFSCTAKTTRLFHSGVTKCHTHDSFPD